MKLSDFFSNFCESTAPILFGLSTMLFLLSYNPTTITIITFLPPAPSTADQISD